MTGIAYYIFLWPIARLVIACGKSLAVASGKAWIDSRGGFHWRGE